MPALQLTSCAHEITHLGQRIMQQAQPRWCSRVRADSAYAPTQLGHACSQRPLLCLLITTTPQSVLYEQIA